LSHALICWGLYMIFCRVRKSWIQRAEPRIPEEKDLFDSFDSDTQDYTDSRKMKRVKSQS
jgi:hypothetical protein